MTSKREARGRVVKMTSAARRQEQVFLQELEAIVDDMMSVKTGASLCLCLLLLLFVWVPKSAYLHYIQ